LDILKLKTRPRNGTGKSVTRKIRTTGWIPAIVYGRKKTPQLIEVDGREFAALLRGRKLTHLIDLGIGSQEESVAVIKEVQRHVLKDNLFYHIDFQHVAMDEKITVEVPIEVVGIPIGVKESGGVLGHPVKAVKFECLPGDIPEKISIDVSALSIGDSIHIRDVVVANGVIKESADEVVAVVTHPTREIVDEPKVAAEGEAAAGEGAAAGAEGAAPAAEGAAPAAPGATKQKPDKKDK